MYKDPISFYTMFGITDENSPAPNEDPREGAGILLINKNTKEMLFLFRNDFDEENTWCTPGGGVDVGETPYEAAMREMYEEALIPKEKYKMKKEPIFINKVSDDFTFYNFMAECDENIEPMLNFEHSEFGWFKYNDLPEPLHPGLKKMFKAIDTEFLQSS